jgi:hypothetical protein
MITEAATTQDLLATITNARLLGTVSFEEGCAVLDAIELFDRRTASGKLGTWLEYSAGGWNALRFVPATDTQEDRYKCGCVAITRITDRDYLHNEEPFEMRLAIPCGRSVCELAHLRTER